MTFAGPASGHGEHHPYESVISGIVPARLGAGIEVRILDFDSQVELTNRSSRRVVVLGYEGEPYARLDPDGSVYLNQLSPSTPLSSDRFGLTAPTGRENAKAPPRWTLVASDGTLAWFDRRVHYRRRGIPPVVKDPEERTRIRQYRIPLLVGATPAAIEGSLYWVGKDKFPTGPFLFLLVATGLCGIFGGWALKRMRGRDEEDPGVAESTDGQATG